MSTDATGEAGTEPTVEGEVEPADGGAPERSVESPAVDAAAAAEPEHERGFDRSPTPLSSRLSLGAALASVLIVGAVQPAGGMVAAFGLVLAAIGIGASSLGAVVGGSLLLFGGVLVAGAFGAPPVPLVAATLGALLTWDLGDQAITLGRQVGHDADTRRGELVHAAISLAVGGATGGVVLALYRTATGGFPVTALIVLLLAAAALASALRP